MKLKYYLKGFGVGVLFATIIIGISFYVSGGGKEMSDKDIVSRAKILGMVAKEEVTSVVKETGLVEDTTTVEETTTEEEATTEEETTTRVEESAPIEETTAIEETIGDTSASPITIIIEKGWSSDRIASILEKNGIISDSKKFNEYLIGQGISRKLQAGTYQMYPGMTYEDISNMIK